MHCKGVGPHTLADLHWTGSCDQAKLN